MVKRMGSMRGYMMVGWRVVVLLTMTIGLGLGGPAPVAAGAPGAFSAGAVVSLVGTPHIWIADEQGMLHWNGDTRALATRAVDWGKRTTATLEQLRGYRKGDPWLSAGLVKDGDPIYLAKWEADAERPTLLRIQSIGDVELIGISGSNYGALVIDKGRWEQQFGFPVGTLQKGELGGAAPASTAQAASTVTAGWTGTWRTNWGGEGSGSATMTLVQVGDRVTGTYTSQDGRIEGTVVGNRLTGRWMECTDREEPEAGGIIFTLAPDGRSFSGTWGYGADSTPNTWEGTRS